MGGILGRLLHEFAVTITVAILVSGFVSLTLSPMLCSRFLVSHERKRHGRLYRISESFFDGMLRVYDVTLKWVLRHSSVTLGLCIFLTVFTGYLFTLSRRISFRARTRGRWSGSLKEHRGYPSRPW